MNTPNSSDHTPEKSAPSGLYTLPENLALNSLLDQIDQQHRAVIEKKEQHPEIWTLILSKLRTDWTYHSNSLEGSTLSRGETHFFLTEGLTVEGKPFQDFLDARNHADAIDFLYQILKNERQITESVIKEINALLLSGTQYTPAVNQQGERVRKPATPGQYKTLPNHVIQADGTLHRYADPLLVTDQMQELVSWIHSHINPLHPVITASIAHYNMVRIHPFDDGNGRGARILMNLILMKQGFFPAVVHLSKKRYYLEALMKADQGDILPFITFIANELIETQTSVLNDIQKALG